MSTAMQTATRRILVGVGFLFGFLLIGQPALAQITGSKHDLTAATNAYYVSGQGTAAAPAEICAFCHTPHGGLSTAPLWNRGSGTAPASFTTYSSATMDGEVLQVGSISAACLSCHDGATALDLLINAPGSGGYNALGASAGYTWTGGSDLSAAGITNIGTDLSNDHPVGVPYCGGVTASGVANCKDGDFFTTNLQRNSGGTVTAADYPLSASPGDQFWIDTTGGTSGVREKTDLLLYVRAFTLGSQPSVECATCHEPHNGGAGGTPFLRIANTTSNMCLTCHNK